MANTPFSAASASSKYKKSCLLFWYLIILKILVITAINCRMNKKATASK